MRFYLLPLLSNLIKSSSEKTDYAKQGGNEKMDLEVFS